MNVYGIVVRQMKATGKIRLLKEGIRIGKKEKCAEQHGTDRDLDGYGSSGADTYGGLSEQAAGVVRKSRSGK